MKPAVLYITYDGVLEPLGESQVVAYLERLAAGYAITLLSFEKPADLADAARVSTMQSRLTAAGIAWERLTYTKRPPVLSTALDILAGIARAKRIIRSRGVRIVHARSYVPALIALRARPSRAVKFLFDMRGFWVDEKVEAGHWPRNGLLHRVGKWWERRFYAEADGVVSLTQAGVDALPELGVTTRPGIPIAVIPTCADLTRFSPASKDRALAAQLGLGDGPTLGCVGTLHNWYMHDDIIAALGVFAREWPALRILIVTRDDRDALMRDLERAGVPRERVTVTQAPFSEMPRYMRLIDVGLFFITPTFSKRASAATKLAEFLGCGIPVVINGGVGDSGTLVRAADAGVVLDDLQMPAFKSAVSSARALLNDVQASSRCRALAESTFDLSVGADRYAGLYRRLLAS